MGHHRLLAVGTIVVLTVAALEAASPRFPYATVEDAVVRANDLASHTRYAAHVLTEGGAYTTSSHTRMMDGWTGDPSHAMPFAYAPTGILVLGLLGFLPALPAYLLWAAIGAVGLYVIGRREGVPHAGALALFGPMTLLAVRLGQTAPVTLLMLYVVMRSRCGWWPAAAMALITMKPSVAMIGVVGLLATLRDRTVIRGLMIASLATLVLTPLLGLRWPIQYVDMLTHYRAGGLDPIFADAMASVEVMMSTLRSVLALSIHDALAARISASVWIVAMASIVWAGRTNRIDESSAWSLAALSFVLFCPHVTFTDQLHLVIVAVTLGTRRTWWTVAVVLVLASGMGFLAALRPWGIFTVQMALAGWVLARSRASVGLAS